MIVRHPTAVTLAQLYASFNRDPATAIGLEAGNTEPPTAYTLPSYVIQTIQNAVTAGVNIRTRYYAQLNITPPPTAPSPGPAFSARFDRGAAAAEGNNRSLYLTAGVYETNYTMDVDDYNIMKEDETYAGTNVAAAIVTRWSEGQPRVYLVMPGDIAALNQRAEQEHCEDFIQAYNITLDLTQQIITQLNGQMFGPTGTAPAARQLAEQAFLALVPDELKSLGLDMAKWGQKYLSLCEKSKTRDVRKWHSWGIEMIDASKVSTAPTYLTNQQRSENGRIYLCLTRGVTEVDQHASNTVVTY